jgi:hypothetical protein
MADKETKRYGCRGLPGPGRPPGVPNKTTSDVRAAIAKFAEETAEDFMEWVQQIKDPSRRCDIWLRTIEYHIPKLQRSELTGKDGKDLTLRVLTGDDAL